MAINSENNDMMRNEINLERKFSEILSKYLKTVLDDFPGFLTKLLFFF